MKRIYSVYDKVARAYHALTLFGHDAPAVRSFSDALLDEKSPWSGHPRDFELHCLGTIAEDGDPGQTIVGFSQADVIVSGSAVVAQAGSGPSLAQEA